MPMRWPRQQVRKVLSARTPRSSGAPTRLRECAGGGELRNGIGDGPCGSGPLPSIGSPSALTTRPSQADDGRTCAAALAITARQPRRTPSSPANGITIALLPVKPITSQGIARLPPVSTTIRAPTDIAWIGPAISTIRPRTPDHPAINIDAVDIADLLGQGLHCETLKFLRVRRCPLTSCLPASLIIASLSLVAERARPSERRCESRESVRPDS